MPLTPIYDIIQEACSLKKSERLEFIKRCLHENGGPLFSRVFLMIFDSKHKVFYPRVPTYQQRAKGGTDVDTLLDYLHKYSNKDRKFNPKGFATKISHSLESYTVVTWILKGYIPELKIAKSKLVDLVPWLGGHLSVKFPHKNRYFYNMYIDSFEEASNDFLSNKGRVLHLRAIGQGTRLSVNRTGWIGKHLASLPPTIRKEALVFWNACKEHTKTANGIDFSLSFIYDYHRKWLWIRDCSLFLDGEGRKWGLKTRYIELNKVYESVKDKVTHLRMWEYQTMPPYIGLERRQTIVKQLFFDGYDEVECYSAKNSLSEVSDFTLLFSMTEELPIENYYSNYDERGKIPVRLMTSYGDKLRVGVIYQEGIRRGKFPFLVTSKQKPIDEHMLVHSTGVDPNGYPCPSSFIKSSKLTAFNPLTPKAYMNTGDITNCERYSSFSNDTLIKNYLKRNISKLYNKKVLDFGCGVDYIPWEINEYPDKISLHLYDFMLDSSHVNLKEEYYDVVFLSDVLPFTRSKSTCYKILLLVYALVKRGGTIYLDFAEKNRRNKYFRDRSLIKPYLSIFFNQVVELDEKGEIFKCRKR